MITCYRDLHVALRKRADDIGVSRARIDELAGLPSGYAAKVLADPPMKRMGPDVIFAVAGALGLCLKFLDDPEAAPRVVEAYKSRDQKRTNTSPACITPSTITTPRQIEVYARRRGLKLFIRASRKAGRARWKGVPKEQRSKIMRRVAKRRWKAAKTKRSNPCPKSGTVGCPQMGKALRLSRSN